MVFFQAFTRQDLEANDSLSKHQVWKLISYLENIRVALSKLTSPNTKPTVQITQKDSPQSTHYTLNYIARGSGLTVAQMNNKVYFKIYPTAQQSLDPGEITVLINGPKETYGMTVVPPILGKSQMIRQNILGLQSKTTLIENVLPITHGTTYLRTYGKSDMSKTFHIPKTKYDIDIEIELKQDHARIGYMATLEGNYEISIINRGQNIVGSPFIVTTSNDVVKILERDSFCLEDGEEIDIVDVKTDRKVVLRIVDFVTEKMLLNENGTLEKISEEEAKYLMENDNLDNINDEVLVHSTETKHGALVKINMKSKKFYNSVNKILTANRFCNMLNDIKNKQYLTLTNYNTKISKNKQDVPDIVNSTYCDDRNKSCQKEKRDRIIIPENISVSLLTEKPETTNKYNESDSFLHSEFTNNKDMYISDPFEDDNISVDTVQSSNNPFLSDICNENYGIEKTFGSFITNEFESNNSQNEETAKANVKVVIENEISSEATNPFLDVLEIERPKTPVYKIITGEVTGRDDSVYIEDKNLSNEIFRNSPNPFIDQESDQKNTYQEKPDFIIGAPVSLPPIVNLKSSTSSVNNNITEIAKIKQKKNNKVKDVYDYKRHITDSATMPILSVDTGKSSNNSNNSLDSNLTEDINISPNSSPTPSNASNQIQASRETSPRKDTWDSAYVSIDDNHFTENSEINSEPLNKKLQLPKEHSKLNLVEKEQWQGHQHSKDVMNADDDYNKHKCEKRLDFMPIIEENEKIFLNSTKDKTEKKTVADPVAVAFADINDIYDDLFKNSEVSSETTKQDCQSQNLDIDFTLERNENHVDSASEFRTDVKRQTKILEGKISEIQANVTESVSVSRNLRAKGKQYYKEENNNENIDRIQFGDPKYTNIVLEKKKYWDERIRQIEAAKSDEIKSQQNRRRLTSKHLRRNDSLSKRRGKKIVQNFLSTNQDEFNSFKQPINQLESIFVQNNLNIDENEKRCLNNNTEINQNESTTCFGKKSSDDKDRSVLDAFKQLKVSSVDLVDTAKDNEPSSNLHLKQELSEKLFQAFETSPKRFFGTSRQHILNKIDTFLGLPDNENETKKISSHITHETGLVSSRISLFHNISQTEELPWSRRKCISMYNITHQDSEKHSHHMSKSKTIQDSQSVTKKETKKISTSCDEPDRRVEKTEKNETSLKEKRARMIQNKYNKSFDETFYTPANYIEATNDYVKRTINEFNKQNETKNSTSTKSKLKSISKSEMDIFNKITTTPEEVLEKHKSYEELPKINVKSFISLYESVSKTSIMKNATTSRSRRNFESTNSLPVPSSVGKYQLLFYNIFKKIFFYCLTRVKKILYNLI